MTKQESAVKMPLFVRVAFALNACSRAVNALVQASVVGAAHIVLKGHAVLLKSPKRRRQRKPQQLKQHPNQLRQQLKKSQSLNVQRRS